MSGFYDGDSGVEYFAWQDVVGRAGAVLNKRKFEDFTTPDTDVMDFGCGGGHLLMALPAAHRIGVEPNPAARASAAASGIEMYSRATDVPSESADIVITNHALEHAQDPLSELKEIHRVLRPGGTLVAVVPSERSTHQYIEGDVSHHLFTWTPLTFGNLLGDAGFSSIRATVLWHAWRTQYLRFAKLPGYDALAWLTAHALRSPQVVAHASRGSSNPDDLDKAASHS